MSRNPTPPNLTPNPASRAPRTTVELQVVADRLVAELQSSALDLVLVPVDRTVSDGRAVILTRSDFTKDIFGNVIEYLVPKTVHGLVHDGQQPFAFTSDAVSSRAISRLVERRTRLRVDVYVTRSVDEFAELRAKWRV